MKIGFLLPSIYSIGNPGNGVLAQANYQAASLEKLGCTVDKLNPWDVIDPGEYDVIQYFQGGFDLYGIENERQYLTKGILVFAPIIDSNQSNFNYRIASRLGNIVSKIYTAPGVYYNQAKLSDLTVVRSKHEQQRIVKGLSIDCSRVEIVLNGMIEPENDRNLIDSIKQKLELPDEFVLHVSAYTQDRKNVVRLAKAVAALGLPLIIAGKACAGDNLDELKSIACQNKNIRLMGFMDNDVLHALYTCCKVFCLPSAHEGTGLVALEAAARGANIVITKNGGPPDYFGGLAEYVDPYNDDEKKTAIQKAWNKKKSNVLSSHIRQYLTWDNSAKQLIAAYEKHIKIKHGHA